MKRNNGGFSLVEIVVAMAMLGAFATAACTSLVLAHRMNGKTDSMLQAQLAVSSAIETMMAEGIREENDNYMIDRNSDGENDYPNITIATNHCKTTVIDETTGSTNEIVLPYFKVTVTNADASIEVTTHIRKAVTE